MSDKMAFFIVARYIIWLFLLAMPPVLFALAEEERQSNENDAAIIKLVAVAWWIASLSAVYFWGFHEGQKILLH